MNIVGGERKGAHANHLLFYCSEDCFQADDSDNSDTEMSESEDEDTVPSEEYSESKNKLETDHPRGTSTIESSVIP